MRILLLPLPAFTANSALAGDDQAPFVEHVAQNGSLFGNAVLGLGDVDGDGVVDYAVSQYAGAGIVLVYSGATGTLLYQRSGGHGFGFAMDRAGDVDGDGGPDFVVGGNDRARVYRGRDGVLLHEVSGSGSFGFAVTGDVDLNADGVPDFGVGSYSDDTLGKNAGKVEFFSGVDGSALQTHYGSLEDDWFGYALDGVGDVDGDGVDDWVVGLPHREVGGKHAVGVARVLSGQSGALLYEWKGTKAGGTFGSDVANVGDLDGDGTADVGVGADDYSDTLDGRGLAKFFSGATGALLFEYVGGSVEQHLGRVVTGAGDFDGDGRDDFVIASVWSDFHHVDVRSGVDGELLAHFDEGRSFGVADLGDLDHDGRDDVIIGAPQDVVKSWGHAYVFLGKDAGVPGDEYCAPAVANSSGTWADLFTAGSRVVAQNELRIAVQRLPPGQAALLLASEQSALVQGPGGSQGVLCLGGSVVRWPDAKSAGPVGSAEWHVDLASFPGGGAVLPGDTWRFQVWYRDANPTPTSNFTDASSILFQ